MKNTAAIFLTYQNRHRFFTPLIDRLLAMQVRYLIIVDNNAADVSKQALVEYKRKYPRKIHLIVNEKNIGTAKAFTQGIQRALELGVEYLWLLDDDLMPERDALESLFKVWEVISDSNKKSHVMLLSNRIEKKIYWQAFVQNRPNIIIGEKNQFRSFHFFHIFDKIVLKFSNKKYSLSNKLNLKIKQPSFNLINAACYGGMFLHRDLIQRLGFPKEEYVVYMDDFDFSYRNILKGGSIYFVPDSVLKDQEESWNNAQKRFAFMQIAFNNNYTSLYYSIRNRIYFEIKNYVNNYLVYYINLLIYSATVIFFALIAFKFRNIAVYIRAVHDGLMKKMGISSNYPL